MRSDKFVISPKVKQSKGDLNVRSVSYSVPRVGVYRCSIFVLFKPADKFKKLHISGSPFLINAVSTEGVPEFLGIPLNRTIGLEEFMRYVAVAGPGNDKMDSKRAQSDYHLLGERCKHYGIGGLSTTLPVIDIDCQMKLLATQLLGNPKKSPFVRKSVAGWLRSHPNFALRDNSCLQDWVQSQSWEEYCVSVERESSFGDILTLIAAAHFFGVRIVVVSSVDEVPRFITEIQPKLMKIRQPLLVGHFCDFGWISLSPYKEHSLFKLETSSTAPITTVITKGSRKPTFSLSPRNQEFKIKSKLQLIEEVEQPTKPDQHQQDEYIEALMKMISPKPAKEILFAPQVKSLEPEGFFDYMIRHPEPPGLTPPEPNENKTILRTFSSSKNLVLQKEGPSEKVEEPAKMTFQQPPLPDKPKEDDKLKMRKVMRRRNDAFDVVGLSDLSQSEQSASDTSTPQRPFSSSAVLRSGSSGAQSSTPLQAFRQRSSTNPKKTNLMLPRPFPVEGTSSLESSESRSSSILFSSESKSSFLLPTSSNEAFRQVVENSPRSRRNKRGQNFRAVYGTSNMGMVSETDGTTADDGTEDDDDSDSADSARIVASPSLPPSESRHLSTVDEIPANEGKLEQLDSAQRRPSERKYAEPSNLLKDSS